jgi:uncharacterized protein YidB (DUF937 family)
MGLLDELLGGVLGGASGQQRGSGNPQAAGSGGSILTALLPVLLTMLAGRGAGAGGGLGDILGQALGGRQGGSGGGGSLSDILGGALGGGGTAGGAGGLGGLLEQMQRAGLGEQARSWVGTGQNMPISPDAVGQIFGQDGVEEIARRAGLTPEQTSEGLSELLPEVVDRVTPQGEVPGFDQLIQSVDDLQRRMGA